MVLEQAFQCNPIQFAAPCQATSLPLSGRFCLVWLHSLDDAALYCGRPAPAYLPNEEILRPAAVCAPLNSASIATSL